jgi:predicted DNA-binding transcriptional regulator YafY
MASASSEALQRVARLFTIVTLVRSQTLRSQTPDRPLGRQALADACQCDIRTVQRDLRLLQEAGISIDYDPHCRSYVLPEKGWVFPVAPLTPEDALALALARGILAMPGLPQSEALRAALDKVTGSLSPALSALMQGAAQVLQPGTLARDYSRAPIPELIAAASARHAVEVDYRSRSRSERCWRRVDPYMVEARAGQFWEMHGWCHRNAAIRTFALDQVFGIREVGETFPVRETEWAAFAASKGIVGGLRGGAAVAVNVVFLPPLAAYARDQTWPEGLHLELQDDGTARLTGTAQGTDGLVAELLRWRRFCRVDGGTELRARMAEEVRAMANLYE